MDPFEDEILCVLKERGRSPGLLVVTTLAFIGQTAGVDVGMAIDTHLGQTEIGCLSPVLGKTRQNEGAGESFLMTRVAVQSIVSAGQRKRNVGMLEPIWILSIPGQGADQREIGAKVLWVTLGALVIAGGQQEGVVALVRRHLSGDFLVTGKTSCRQAALCVTSIASS